MHLCVFLLAALPNPVVRISPANPTVPAGDRHTMTCTVTASSYLTVQPTVEILGPDGSVIVTGTGLELRTTLDPVRTSDAGEYTCRASVVIASVSVDVSGERSSTLTVESESVVEYQYYMCMCGPSSIQSLHLMSISLQIALLLCMLVLASLSHVL